MTDDSAKPIKQADSDRSQPIDTDPVAWALMRHGEVEQVAVHPVYLRGDIHRVAPLYAHQPPMLTVAEREAVQWAFRLAEAFPEFDNTAKCAAVLRGLLERSAKRDTNGPRNGAVDTPAPQTTPGECSTPGEDTSG